jgi:hypothetical protein
MGNIGSHVDITSGWRGHQANIEADGASRSGNWSDGDLSPATWVVVANSSVEAKNGDTMFSGERV